MAFDIDAMPDDETVQAVMYGPLVLAGRFEEVTKDMSYGDYEPKRGNPRSVPGIVAEAGRPSAWIEPDAKQSLRFKSVGQSQVVILVPLYQVIHERYAVYWKVEPKSA